MLFRKKVPHCCAYCVHAGHIDDHQMICRRKGIVAAADQCRRFRYDPLKRVPARPKPQTFDRFHAGDFQL